MTKEKGIPQIRFSGFTDTWEQREVSNVAMISTGGTPSTAINEYWNPKQVPWLSSGEVHKKYITYTDDKISNEGLNHSSARMIKQNSVLIALAGQGKTRGTVAINRISLSTNQSIAAMTFAPDICPEFVFSNLESRYDELRKVSSGDGTRGGLNKQLVSEIQIPYTSLNEQRKIGQFFTHLDRLITLHQRKYEKLVNIKKSMLDKMFPQNGASVPEIRFKGFTDPWEQRKVGTLIEDYTEKTVTQNQYPVLTSSQQQGIVLQEDYFADRQVTTDNNVGYYVLPKGYFTYRSRSDTDVFVFNRNNIVDKGIISYYYPVFAPKSCDSNFLLRRLNHGIKKQLSMAAEGTGQKVLAHAKFKNMVVDVPSQSEQEKIGTILEELDTLITLHQRKLEKLQNIKKSCLEKMFV